MCINCLFETGKRNPPEKTNRRAAAQNQSQTGRPTPVLPKRNHSPTRRKRWKTELHENSPATTGVVAEWLLETEILHRPKITQLSRGTGILLITVVAGVAVVTFQETMVVILVGAEAETSQPGETTTETGETGSDQDTPLPREIVPMLILQTDIGGGLQVHLGGKYRQRHHDWALQCKRWIKDAQKLWGYTRIFHSVSHL